jgi:hypothetical protein
MEIFIMNDEDIMLAAQELRDTVMAQINEARVELAKKMIEKGLSPELYCIADNFNVLVENPEVPYQCWPELRTDLLKPRMTRGRNE